MEDNQFCSNPECCLSKDDLSEHSSSGGAGLIKDEKWFCSTACSECKGLVFRANESSWFDKKNLSFNHREGLRLLKKDSCKCESCKMALDHLSNYGEDLLDCVYWNKTIGVSELKDGSKYRLVVDDWDCEDGFCFIWKFHMEEVK